MVRQSGLFSPKRDVTSTTHPAVTAGLVTGSRGYLTSGAQQILNAGKPRNQSII
jgi:hypothetical protein